MGAFTSTTECKVTPVPVQRQEATRPPTSPTTSKPSDAATTNHRAVPHLDAQERALVKRLMLEYPTLDQLMAETIVWDYFRKEERGVPHLHEAECCDKLPSTEAPEVTGGWFLISDPPPGTPPDAEKSPPPMSAQRSDKSGTSVD